MPEIFNLFIGEDNAMTTVLTNGVIYSVEEDEFNDGEVHLLTHFPEDLLVDDYVDVVNSLLPDPEGVFFCGDIDDGREGYISAHWTIPVIPDLIPTHH